jgi:hypothetical protein
MCDNRYFLLHTFWKLEQRSVCMSIVILVVSLIGFIGIVFSVFTVMLSLLYRAAPEMFSLEDGIGKFIPPVKGTLVSIGKYTGFVQSNLETGVSAYLKYAAPRFVLYVVVFTLMYSPLSGQWRTSGILMVLSVVVIYCDYFFVDKAPKAEQLGSWLSPTNSTPITAEGFLMSLGVAITLMAQIMASLGIMI